MVTFARRRKLLNAALLVNLVRHVRRSTPVSGCVYVCKWPHSSCLRLQLLSSALLLATLFLLETPFVGFDAFVTAGVLVAYAFSTVVLLNKAPSAYAVR